MKQPTFITFLKVAVLSACLLSSSAQADNGCCEELKQLLQRQSDRITQLEDTVRSLETTSQSRPVAGGSNDPLIGTWECTNGVLTHHMTFVADGHLIQEAATFGPTRELTWTRVNSEEILLSGGITIRINFSSDDRMSAENSASRAKWDCQKISN